MNKVFIKVTSNHTINPTGFIGIIIFEKRDNGIYFNWEVKTLQGEFLGMKGDFISINIIPSNTNSFDYALSYAIESIKKYRISRKKVFEIKEYHWENI